MSILSQQKHQRQRMVKYAANHPITETAIRYGVSRKTVYKWIKRYDGTTDSLVDHSHKPLNSPKKHTDKEIKQIKKRLKKHKWQDLILAFQELVEKDGYTRSYGGFKRVVAQLKASKPQKKKQKRKPKPYKRAEYPGQKIQLDVKFVPSYCVVDGKKYYQYTAVDECTRWTFREMYDEHSTCSSKQFLERLIEKAPFPIREIQTDNGTEFTYKYISDDVICPFDKALQKLRINHKLIPPRTPWHNGKVERSHRNDQRYFYDWETFTSVEELNKKLKDHLEWSNSKRMRTLDWKSAKQLLAEKLSA